MRKKSLYFADIIKYFDTYYELLFYFFLGAATWHFAVKSFTLIMKQDTIWLIVFPNYAIIKHPNRTILGHNLWFLSLCISWSYNYFWKSPTSMYSHIIFRTKVLWFARHYYSQEMTQTIITCDYEQLSFLLLKS